MDAQRHLNFATGSRQTSTIKAKDTRREIAWLPGLYFSGVRGKNSKAIHQWCARYYLFESVELWRRLQWSDSQVGQQHITFCWWKTNIKYSIYFLSYYSQEGDLRPPFLRSCSQGFFGANCNGILVSGGCQVLSFSLWGAVPWDQVYECLHPFTLRFQIGFQGN